MEASTRSKSGEKTADDAGAGEVAATIDAENAQGYRGFSPHDEAGKDDTLSADDALRSGAYVDEASDDES